MRFIAFGRNFVSCIKACQCHLHTPCCCPVQWQSLDSPGFCYLKHVPYKVLWVQLYRYIRDACKFVWADLNCVRQALHDTHRAGTAVLHRHRLICVFGCVRSTVPVAYNASQIGSIGM